MTQDRLLTDEELKRLIVLSITINAPPRSPRNPLHWKQVTDKLLQMLEEYGYQRKADTQREIGEWGNKKCPHADVFIGCGDRKRHCDKCWKALKSGTWKEVK